MSTERVWFMAAGRHIGTMHVAPLVEAIIRADAVASVQTCLAQARPLGFAILDGDRGYWLAGPGDATEIAAAINRLTTQANAAACRATNPGGVCGA